MLKSQRLFKNPKGEALLHFDYRMKWTIDCLGHGLGDKSYANRGLKAHTNEMLRIFL